MKRIHYLLLGLLVSLTIAAVSPTLPPTRIAPGTNVTVVTNGVNSFTISATGGAATNAIANTAGLGTNTTIYGLTINTGSTNNSLTASRAVVTDANKGVISSSVTATELAYVSGVTGNIQTNLDQRASTNIQVIAGSNVTITTNSVNSWTIASSGGGGSGILTSNGLGTNTTFYATAGTTNRPAIFISTNTALSSYFDKDSNLVIGTNTAASSGVMIGTGLDSFSIPTKTVLKADGTAGAGTFLGQYFSAGNDATASGSGKVMYFNGNGGKGLTLANNYGFGWNSSAGGSVSGMNSVDTLLTRRAANVIEATSGTTGIANRSTFEAAILTGRAGTSTSPFNASGVIWYDVTATGNVGAGEDTILTNNFGANVFSANGDSVDLKFTGTFANNANARNVKLYLAGQTVFDAGGSIVTSGAKGWDITCNIVRSGASTLEVSTTWAPDYPTTGATLQVQQATLTIGLTTNNPVRLTAEAVADNDVVRRIGRAFFMPAP
jgi:hypothetical protein